MATFQVALSDLLFGQIGLFDSLRPILVIDEFCDDYGEEMLSSRVSSGFGTFWLEASEKKGHCPVSIRLMGGFS